LEQVRSDAEKEQSSQEQVRAKKVQVLEGTASKMVETAQTDLAKLTKQLQECTQQINSTRAEIERLQAEHQVDLQTLKQLQSTVSSNANHDSADQSTQSVLLHQPKQISLDVAAQSSLAPQSSRESVMSPSNGVSNPQHRSPLASSPLASSPLASSPLASSPLASNPVGSNALASSPVIGSSHPTLSDAGIPSSARLTEHTLQNAPAQPSSRGHPEAGLKDKSKLADLGSTAAKMLETAQADLAKFTKELAACTQQLNETKAKAAKVKADSESELQMLTQLQNQTSANTKTKSAQLAQAVSALQKLSSEEAAARHALESKLKEMNEQASKRLEEERAAIEQVFSKIDEIRHFQFF
jgi:uncharacterized phage infection (PIP) family protein YhgE